jgi:hypothetical protein
LVPEDLVRKIGRGIRGGQAQVPNMVNAMDRFGAKLWTIAF